MKAAKMEEKKISSGKMSDLLKLTKNRTNFINETEKKNSIKYFFLIKIFMVGRKKADS